MTVPLGITIALVDDSLLLRKLLSTYLTAQGFCVVCEADNGQQMLDAMADALKLPDMCLLDTNMPVMDGYETARRLRADYPTIKIMGYSFFDNKKSAASILRSGAHDFISKDASADELRDALTQLFNKQQLSSASCAVAE